MKKILVFWFIISALNSFAQNLVSFNIAPYISENQNIIGILGQISNQYYATENGLISEGFLQTYFFPTDTSDNNQIPENFQCIIFPNPAKDFAKIFLSYENLNSAEVSIFDLNGKMIFFKKFCFNNQIQTTILLDLQSLNKGIYILKININSQFFVNYKILKQ